MKKVSQVAILAMAFMAVSAYAGGQGDCTINGGGQGSDSITDSCNTDDGGNGGSATGVGGNINAGNNGNNGNNGNLENVGNATGVQGNVEGGNVTVKDNTIKGGNAEQGQDQSQDQSQSQSGVNTSENDNASTATAINEGNNSTNSATNEGNNSQNTNNTTVNIGEDGPLTASSQTTTTSASVDEGAVQVDASDNSVTTYEDAENVVSSVAPSFSSICSSGGAGQGRNFALSLAVTNDVCQALMLADAYMALGDVEEARRWVKAAARHARVKGGLGYIRHIATLGIL